jgi:hypothetical protein
MSDDDGNIQRKAARNLATNILRDPYLALEYRNLISDSFEDSQSERLVTQWMTKAGYATTHDLFHDEVTNAPHTNLAAWDGIYVIRLNTGPLLALEISGFGVRLNQRTVSAVRFNDGVLTFGPTEYSPWNGELTFTAVTPMQNGRSLSEGGVFQRSCTGKLWKKDEATPQATNAAGATVLQHLPPSPTVDAENAAAIPTLVASMADPASPTFIGKWAGDYTVTMVSTDPTTLATYQPGPNYGVAGSTDQQATLTFVTPHDLDLTKAIDAKNSDRIVYSDGQRNFDLTFGIFYGKDRGFSGKIYPEKATDQTVDNVAGVAKSPLDPPSTPSDGASVYSGLAIAAATLLAALGALIVTAGAVLFSDYLTRKREYQTALQEHDGEAITRARDNLRETQDILARHREFTTTNVSNFGLFGEYAARTSWAKEEVQRIDTLAGVLKASALDVSHALQPLNESIKTAEQGFKYWDDKIKNDLTDRSEAERQHENEQRAEFEARVHELRPMREFYETALEHLVIERKGLEHDLIQIHKL